MKFSNCTKTFLLLCLSIGSIPHIQADTNNPIAPINAPAILEASQLPELTHEQQQELFEKLLQDIFKQLTSIESILEELSWMVNENKVSTVIDKKEVIDSIKQLREIVDIIKKESFITVDPSSIYVLLNLNSALIDHLAAALNNNLQKFPPFDLQGLMTRALPTDLEPDTIEKLFADNTEKLQQLSRQSHDVGLRWYNKAYRTTVHYCQKFYIPQITVTTLAAGSVAFFMWWYATDRGSANNPGYPIEQWLRKRLGYPYDIYTWHYNHDTPTKHQPSINHSQASVSTPDKAEEILAALCDTNSQATTAVPKQPTNMPAAPTLREFGKIDHGLTKGSGSIYDPNSKTTTAAPTLREFGKLDHGLTKGFGSIGAFLVGLLMHNISKPVSNSYRWSKKKLTLLHNHLMGGHYSNLMQQESIVRCRPRYTFADVEGCEDNKEAVSNLVKFLTEDSEVYYRLNIAPEIGWLTYGDSRSGKSFFIEALAGEIQKKLKDKNKNPDDVRFYVLDAACIMQQGIAAILEEAKTLAPCILFIDEIHLLDLQDTGVNRTLLSEFLTYMSGFTSATDPKKPVIIFAATNKVTNMADALKKYGRFGKHLHFSFPGFTNRKNILIKKLNTLSINFSDFDVDKLAHETEHCSYEELNAIIKCALQRAKIKGIPLNQKLLEEVLDAEIRRIATSDNNELPDHERCIIAAHQAGHALSALLLPTHQKLARVTIRPILARLVEETIWQTHYQTKDTMQNAVVYGDTFIYHPDDTINVVTLEEKLNECKIELAGFAAEKLLLGACGYSYHLEDKQQALAIAKSVAFEGLQNVKDLPKETQGKLFEKAFALLDMCEKEITTFLMQYKTQLQALTQALLEKETLSGQEVAAIVGITKTSPATPAQQQAPAASQQTPAVEITTPVAPQVMPSAPTRTQPTSSTKKTRAKKSHR